MTLKRSDLPKFGVTFVDGDLSKPVIMLNGRAIYAQGWFPHNITIEGNEIVLKAPIEFFKEIEWSTLVQIGEAEQAEKKRANDDNDV